MRIVLSFLEAPISTRRPRRFDNKADTSWINMGKGLRLRFTDSLPAPVTSDSFIERFQHRRIP
jgi:hypothetical protein